MKALKLTELGKSYWNSNGVYQVEFDKLTKELMPAEGEGETLHAELIRACNRLTYEYCNNGNCNACEMGPTEYYECHQCKGSGEIYFGDNEGDYGECDYCNGEGEIEEDGDCEVSAMYNNFLKLIRESINTQEISNICSKITIFIEGNHYGSKSRNFDNDINLYNELIDRIVYHVLTTEDKEIPKWYLD